MKNLRSILAALAVLLMATAANAQQTKVTATVPFNFIAGDRVYPAGDYSISSNGFLLKITNDEKSELMLSHACESLSVPADTKLVFDSIGGNYFLRRIWVAGNSFGRELPRSHAEVRLAQNQDHVESVIVAANIAR